MSEQLLSLSQLTYCWPGEQTPVLDIDQLALDAGSQVFVHGPSGCGKSTLLSVVAGVVQPDSGSLHFLGKDCLSMSKHQRDQLRADHMGYVFQQFNLLPYLSVLDNVMLTCQFSKLRRAKAQQRGGSVKQEALRLLDHLQIPDSALAKPVSNLSIGQQQRVAVARALIGSPALLIADEPTSALDSVNRERFMDLLMAELQLGESSLLLVSHDEALAERFDQTWSLAQLNRGGHHEVS